VSRRRINCARGRRRAKDAGRAGQHSACTHSFAQWRARSELILVGMLALGESASVLRLIFLVLILAGIVGLKMVEA
jgi:hypothetical protein